MIADESPPLAAARAWGDFCRMIVRVCLKHWHRHPLEDDFDVPLAAVWEARALDTFEDEGVFRAQHQSRSGS